MERIPPEPSPFVGRRAPARSPREARRGLALFRDRCAGCHQLVGNSALGNHVPDGGAGGAPPGRPGRAHLARALRRRDAGAGRGGEQPAVAARRVGRRPLLQRRERADAGGGRCAEPTPTPTRCTRRPTPPDRRPSRPTSRRRCWRSCARCERAAAVYQPPPEGLDAPLSSLFLSPLSAFLSFLPTCPLLCVAGRLVVGPDREGNQERTSEDCRENQLHGNLLGWRLITSTPL